MTAPASQAIQRRLESTIRVLCLLVEDRLAAQATIRWSEYALRRVLVGCILGSQVRQQMAVATTENLEQAGLLDDVWWSAERDDGFGPLVLAVLSGERRDVPHPGRHRFWRTRAAQLTEARGALVQKRLTARLAQCWDPRRLRETLVADIPGLGPKQASMFLRDIGLSYDLAILDTHVLRFMYMHDLMPVQQARTSTLAGYERAEQVVLEYAESLGTPAGYLDWAIWATMKAAREVGL